MGMTVITSLLVSSLLFGAIEGICTGPSTHKIYVKRGVKRGAQDTRAVATIYLGDQNGNWSSLFRLDISMESTVDLFYINAPAIEDVREIKIDRMNGDGEKWFPGLIKIRDKKMKKESLFPVSRWVHASDPINLVEYDYSLPCEERYPEQRTVELEKQREIYQLSELYPEPGHVVKEFPEEEAKLTKEYQTFKNQSDGAMMMKLRNPAVALKAINNFDDLKNMFKAGNLPIPKRFDNWATDVEFARQRLTGVNGRAIKLCESIPKRFAVTAAMVEPFIEGRKLEDALLEKRIFIVDHSGLEGLNAETYEVPSPYALFYVRDDGILIPIAIQLLAEPASDNPIFLPSDPEYTWLLAKMWFNYADASIQTAAAHFAFTHLIIGPTSIITHRQLSPSHPIYQLVVPHFHQTLAVESTARRYLLSKGALVDQIMGMGSLGWFEIMKRERKQWTYQYDGNIINNFEKRGVASESVLPNYFYRDDSILLWKAIARYVKTIVDNVYAIDQELLEDSEIQAYAKELASPSGLNLDGLPESLECKEDLIDLLTFIIHTSTVEHSAVNDGQYDEYAFFPHYPLLLVTERPKNKTALTEYDIIKALPSKAVMLKTIMLMNNMSDRDGNPLAYFDAPLSYHSTSLKALEKFKSDLKEIGKIIDVRNERVGPVNSYTYLHPMKMKNSITE